MIPATYQENYFESFDKTKIFYRYNKPVGAKATLVIIHGHGEHSGRYMKFIDHVASENYALAIMDLRGHGKSGGRAVYVDSLKDHLDDLTSFLSVLQSSHGVNENIAFLGHSLGGLIAMHWVKNDPQKLKMLILSSPCLGLRLPQFLIGLNSFFNMFIPKMEYRNPVYPPHLTHNPQEMLEYKEDTLIQRKITVRLLSEMIICSNELQKEAEFNFPFPFYVLMADDLERVVDPGATRKIFARVTAPDKKLVSFPGFYHEIFNEVDQKTAFEALKVALREGQKYLSN